MARREKCAEAARACICLSLGDWILIMSLPSLGAYGFTYARLAASNHLASNEKNTKRANLIAAIKYLPIVILMRDIFRRGNLM